MNQTQKRLSIIELAISITDIETIKLQLLKLQPLRSDIRIDNILSELEAENYAQAQHLISEYIVSPDHTVVQRIPEEEQEIIDSFDFLEAKQMPEDDLSLEIEEAQENVKIEEETIETEIENTIDVEQETKKEVTPKVQDKEILDITNTVASEKTYDTLFDIDAQSVLENTIDLNITQDTSDEEKEKIDFALDAIPKDNFFDTLPTQQNTIPEEKKEESPKEEVEAPIQEIVIEDVFETMKSDEQTRETSLKEQPAEVQEKPNNIHYLLQDLQVSYPPVFPKEGYSETLEVWLENIAEDNYTQDDVEEVLKHIEKISQTDKAEAALFLLATSTTKSDYAQFILSRALYRGTLLERNLDESFRIMSQLAYKDHYPQALCDLAQFYENGIATNKDKKEALSLYQEAMELGVERAQKHYERLKEETSGLFSFFK